MKARVKATGEIINVRKVITNIGDELYEPLRLEWSNVKFKASDLDFDVEHPETDLRISVAKLRDVLEKLVADGDIEPIHVSVDEIINRVKKEK